MRRTSRLHSSEQGDFTMQTTRTDIQTRITDQIIAQLENGVRPWAKPWNAEHAAGRIEIPLRWNSENYRGVNVLVLWMTAEAMGYSCPLWLTFNQRKELGGNVKKGERSTHVVYCDKITKDEGTVDERQVFFTRTYCVFNAEQTEGLPDRYYATPKPQIDQLQRNDQAETFIRNTGASMTHGGNSAHYCKTDDTITLPAFEFFRDPESYYATGLHELCHNADYRIMPTETLVTKFFAPVPGPLGSPLAKPTRNNPDILSSGVQSTTPKGKNLRSSEFVQIYLHADLWLEEHGFRTAAGQNHRSIRPSDRPKCVGPTQPSVGYYGRPIGASVPAGLGHAGAAAPSSGQ
jgi:N-terminal domain of anti-restriction factor ArdC/Zincin-like metallopeptidase